LNGAFTIAQNYITFTEVFDIDKYHPEVMTYEVTDEKRDLVAIFYADFFPRKGKRNGAWMTSFKGQYVKDELNERPHISNVCNFTSLLKPNPLY
jgi:peptidyl-dipeptidase Dcp